MKEWFKARNLWGAAIAALPDEDAGKIAKAIWAYTMNGEVVEIDGAGKGILAMILMTLMQDEERNNEISEARAIAGAKGGNQKQANATKEKQNVANDSKSYQTEANVANATIKNKSKRKNEEKESEIMFARFWSVYPRHDSKATARKAFEKINPDEELFATILSAVERQKDTEQWKENGGQYIPYAATWLNQKRWEDEIKEYKKTAKTVVAQQYTQTDYTGVQEEVTERWMSKVREAMGK